MKISPDGKRIACTYYPFGVTIDSTFLSIYDCYLSARPTRSCMPALGWDGIWEGNPHPSDVLIWVAEFEYYDGRLEPQKGEITLVR